MDLSTFIVAVFCLIDDRLKKERRIRRRGPAPKLSDSEVLTMEIVGEFLGHRHRQGHLPFLSKFSFKGTTPSGSPLCARSIAPLSPGRRPISGP